MYRRFLRILFSTALLVFGVLFYVPMNAERHDDAFADELAEPIDAYTRTFTISAYYSPLPCQSRYATGSYDGDIRLNGGGVRGADGTPVYPGMIASPRSYDFGTKMDISGIGIVAVHDRGGAIRASAGVEGVYDRLDVWMGYGDAGLARALQWGKRTMDVVVYGVNDSITEQIALSGYTPDEAAPDSCYIVQNDSVVLTVVAKPVVAESATVDDIAPALYATDVLKKGDSGSVVRDLQVELRRLNFFKGEITGYYGDLTAHAVFKFQQSQMLVGTLMSPGAGIFGPKTRERMREIASIRGYTRQRIAEATTLYNGSLIASAAPRKKEDGSEELLLVSELDFGVRGPGVAALQKFLREQGYFSGSLITDYFGPVTHDALIRFQLANKIIANENDHGAGRVGPSTLNLINKLS